MDGDKQKKDTPQEETGWQYKPEVGSLVSTSQPTDSNPDEDDSGSEQKVVEWTASEFVAHDKGFGWYALLAVGAILVSAGLYLMTKDIFTVVVVLIMAAILGVAGARKPKVVKYRLDNSGLKVGRRLYPYRAYKSFTMPEEGPFISIVLVPLRRFDFPVSAYLAPDSQDKALDFLSSHLPMEPTGLDRLERLMRTLHF
jgi:hypothetical protein